MSTETILLHNISWPTYVAILEVMGDRRLRHTYDNGTLELLSPDPELQRLLKGTTAEHMPGRTRIL